MSSSNATRTEQRRRVLRAAVGAPIVYTLSSGAALAQGSLSCADKSLALYEDLQPLLYAPGDDSFLRTELPLYSFMTMIPGVPGNTSVVGFQYPAIRGLWYRISGDQAYEAPVQGREPQPTGQRVWALLNYDAGVGTLTLVPTILASEINPLAGASCATSLGVTVAGASGGFLDAI